MIQMYTNELKYVLTVLKGLVNIVMATFILYISLLF